MPYPGIINAAAYPIPTSPTWEIMDSTKAKEFQSCPRKFFYKYVLGWRPDESELHFDYGTAFHLAMEHIYSAPEGERFTEAVFTSAFDVFCDSYLRVFGLEDEASNNPKNMFNTSLALQQYMDHYAKENLEVVTQDGKPLTEIAGTVCISDKYIVHFKIDLVAQTNSGITIVDHKTTGSDRRMYQEQWHTDFQPSLYTFAIQSLFHDTDIPVFGMLMNIIILRKPPSKSNPKGKGNAFVRVPIVLTDESLVQWLWEAEYILNDIEHQFELLSESTDSDEVLYAFPRNTTSCTDYNKLCPFHAFCSAGTRTNPLRFCQEPEAGFIINHWDPREKDENAKFVLENGKLKEKGEDND